MKSIENIFSKFDADIFLKSTICGSMFRDSHDFLWRVNCILNNMEHSGYSFISKIYVDLLMAIESDLKNLIIALSKQNESPEDAYKVARNKSHNIIKLYYEVELRAKNRLKLLNNNDKKELLNKATIIKVSNRYHLFSLLQIRDENPADRDFGLGEYSSLLSLEYVYELRKIAFKLHEIVIIAQSRFTVTVAMSGNDMTEYSNRMKEFKSNMGRKL